MKPILICGKRNSGKSELFERLIKELKAPLYGFVTCITSTDSEGRHHIHMFDINDKARVPSEDNLITICKRTEREVRLDTFNELGVRLIQSARPGGVLVMDELGFIETGAVAFCREVFNAFEGPVPVIATVRETGPETGFLDKVQGYPGARLYRITEDNREELYKELLFVIRGLKP
ncbi:MAG: hypothetical protein IIZ75_10485 [Lachnospiraceae bacterium]|nr:hypothetical protein [Lachnospiraceae bacterium]